MTQEDSLLQKKRIISLITYGTIPLLSMLMIVQHPLRVWCLVYIPLFIIPYGVYLLFRGLARLVGWLFSTDHTIQPVTLESPTIAGMILFVGIITAVIGGLIWLDMIDKNKAITIAYYIINHI